MHLWSPCTTGVVGPSGKLEGWNLGYIWGTTRVKTANPDNPGICWDSGSYGPDLRLQVDHQPFSLLPLLTLAIPLDVPPRLWVTCRPTYNPHSPPPLPS